MSSIQINDDINNLNLEDDKISFNINRNHELQRLLANERNRSEKRKINYQKLTVEHLNLHEKFLCLKTEMKLLLEETKLIKESKEQEVIKYKLKLDEKNEEIKRLLLEYKQSNPEFLKDQLVDELKQPLNKLSKENEQLRIEKERLYAEIKNYKQKVDFLEQDKLNLIHNNELTKQAEINLICKEKEILKTKLLEAKNPDYDKIVKLKEENEILHNQIKELELFLDQSENYYKNIEQKMDELNLEHGKQKNKYESELNKQNEQLCLYKQEMNEYKSKITIYECQIDEYKKQILDINTLREGIIKKHLNELNEEELSKKQLRDTIAEQRLCLEKHRDQLLNEIKKIKNEKENLLDEIQKHELYKENKQKEFDKELSNAIQNEKNKFNLLEQQNRSCKVKLNETEEELKKLKEELAIKQKQIEEVVHCKLEIDKENILLKTKLETLLLNENDLDKLKKQFESLYEDFNKLRVENTDLNVIVKQISRENNNLKEECNLIHSEHEEDKKKFNEFKLNSERNLNRVKNSFELERTSLKEEIEDLHDSIREQKRQRTELKAKCVQFCEAAQKLHNRLKQLKVNEKNEDKISKQSFVSGDVYKDLCKQYKQLIGTKNEIQNSNYCQIHHKTRL